MKLVTYVCNVLKSWTSKCHYHSFRVVQGDFWLSKMAFCLAEYCLMVQRRAPVPLLLASRPVATTDSPWIINTYGSPFLSTELGYFSSIRIHTHCCVLLLRSAGQNITRNTNWCAAIIIFGVNHFLQNTSLRTWFDFFGIQRSNFWINSQKNGDQVAWKGSELPGTVSEFMRAPVSPIWSIFYYLLGTIGKHAEYKNGRGGNWLE